MRTRPLGFALVVAALAANPWTIGVLLAPDGRIGSVKVRAAIVALELAAIGIGIAIARRDRRLSAGAALLAGASGVLSLALAEGLFRLLPEFRPVPRWYVGERTSRESRNFLPDSATGWRMRPNHVFTWVIDGTPHEYASNAQGMRAPADVATGCRGPRVVLTGDSFVFGSGVAQRHTIGAQLADSLGGRIEVVNLGMPGFGMDQIWMSVRHQAPPYCPALIVAAFIDDDWDRSLTAFRPAEGMTKPTFVLEGDSVRPQTPADRPGWVTRVVRSRSALYRAVAMALRRREYAHGTGEWWRVNAAIVAAMARDAEASGVPLLLVRLPRGGHWREFPALRREMERTGVPYLDLADPARARDDLHLARDDHFGPLGTAWAAGEIAGWIRRSGPATLHTAGP